MPAFVFISALKDKSIQYPNRPSPKISGIVVCDFDLSGKDGFASSFGTGIQGQMGSSFKGRSIAVNSAVRVFALAPDHLYQF